MATKTMTKPRSTATKTASRSKTTNSNTSSMTGRGNANGTSTAKRNTATNNSANGTSTMSKPARTSRTNNGGTAMASKAASASNGTATATMIKAKSASNGTAAATMSKSKAASKKNTMSARSARMADKAMAGKEFKKFFIDEMKDIYWAEKHLAKALPKMKKAATSEQLKSAFEKHTMETQGHIAMVEKIFAALGEKPKTKKCEAMEGILAECQSIIKDTERDTFVRDASLILGAQKAEHYEIATYGTLRIFAQYLKNKRVVTMLEGILGNEKYTDVSLTKLAEGFINDRAAKE